MKRKDEDPALHKKKYNDKSQIRQDTKLKKEINEEIKESLGDIDTKTIANYVKKFLVFK